MQAVMESTFDVLYIVVVITLGFMILKRAKSRKQFVLFGAMAIVLGVGDAFHLIPRMWALLASGDTGLPAYAPALGFGKLVTSITMTVFYTMLYHCWRQRYGVEGRKNLTFLVYGLAAVRILLCLMPQNRWLDVDAPLRWGIYRNIPFLCLGGLLIWLYFSHREDKPFRFMWLAIGLSFLFYTPVVLFADRVPAVGMLMIPKTLAYVWIVWMGFKAAPTIS